MGLLEDILANILLNRVRYYKAEFFNSRLGFCQNLVLLLEVNRASAVLVNFFWGACYVIILSLVDLNRGQRLYYLYSTSMILIVIRFSQALYSEISTS